MNKFIFKVSLFTFSIVFIIGIVNYFGDAGGIFHKRNAVAKIAKYLSKGFNVTGNYNVDERELQRNIIHLKQDTPSVIVLGSSRVMLIHSDFFKNYSFMNHGVPGASIEDMIAIYQLYKNKGKLPRKIVMGIDPWFFNKYSGQNRWKTLEAEYDTFILSGRQTVEPFVSFDKYYQLFSLSYFQPSIKMLAKRCNEKKEVSIIPTRVGINTTFTRLVDGSISYDLKYRDVKPQDVVNKAKTFISKDVYSLENYTSLDNHSILLFSKFVEEILSNQIELSFVLMPYHPLVYDFLISNNKYKLVFEFEKYIEQYALSQNIPLKGSFNPHKFRLNNSHFYDGMHLTEKGIDIIMGTGALTSPR